MNETRTTNEPVPDGPDEPDQAVADTGGEEALEKEPRKGRALLITAAMVALFAVLMIVSGNERLLNNVLREAISPGTAAVAIAVIGLNLHFGFTGLINIGQAGFMLLGAYGFAISIIYGFPMLLAVLVGLLVSVLFSLVLGAPTLKLRGDYLAIVTISAAEILRYVGRSALLTDFTGAAQGLQGKRYRDPFTDLSFFGGGRTVIGPFDYQNTGVNGWWVRFVAWSLVILCLVIFVLLVRSPWGRLLRGIREDEDAVRSLGKNVYLIKMQALIIGGMFGALGGMVYVLPSSVQPDAMGRSLTFFIFTALLLGGAASIFGPVLGSILFFGARILIRGLANTYVPNEVMNTQQTDQFSYIVVGVGLMLIVIFRPQGILGDKRELRFG